MLTVFSFAATIHPGQHPAADSDITITEVTMTAVVTGIASMLVSRKYFGKEWNRSQASGPVNAWQEMERAAACQMRLGKSTRSWPEDGYQLSSTGYSTVMPVIAR